MTGATIHATANFCIEDKEEDVPETKEGNEALNTEKKAKIVTTIIHLIIKKREASKTHIQDLVDQAHTHSVHQ